MKRRIKKGLLYHCNPNGSSWMSEESKLLKQFQLGTIDEEGLRKLAAYKAERKKVTLTVEITLKLKEVQRPQHYIKCWDKWISCTEQQYNMAPPCARKIEYITVKTW